MNHNGLIQIIEQETHGQSCKINKYLSSDQESPQIIESDSFSLWEKMAESQNNKYINLSSLCEKISGGQILNYFIDGTKSVYKVDEFIYSQNIYPIMAGQIGAACCKRVKGNLSRFMFKHEIIIVLPDVVIANPADKKFFIQALTKKLNDSLASLNIKISAVLTYSTAKDSNLSQSLESRGRTKIEARAMTYEIKLTEYLSQGNLLNHNNYLIKSGSIEYIFTKNLDLNHYRYVVGAVKNFKPSSCINPRGLRDSSYIAELPLYHRTQAAIFTSSEKLGSRKMAVWYLRLYDRTRTNSAFDGVIKLERLLADNDEIIDSSELNKLSAYIINERSPVNYAKKCDIYPVYLTERFAKSKYINKESFLHIF
ncbi:MAG: hypothetical protein IJS99_03465 [Synergistaceae bacterium]|nr:hypothetical protein [Synergistaceae bacterium]